MTIKYYILKKAIHNLFCGFLIVKLMVVIITVMARDALVVIKLNGLIRHIRNKNLKIYLDLPFFMFQLKKSLICLNIKKSEVMRENFHLLHIIILDFFRPLRGITLKHYSLVMIMTMITKDSMMESFYRMVEKQVLGDMGQ